MANLQSPGVQVTVIDESFYTSAAPGTVPLIFVATAQDKSNASSTGTAQGTTAANAGQVWLITSQRDLTDTFGTPLFYTDSNNNPVHGGELNEYGLQAAYSALGVSSRAYVVRADVDLGQLSPRSSAPTGNPVAGTYWIDTAYSLFGINEWNSVTKSFTIKTPLIIDDSNQATAFSGSVPQTSFGSQGDYAMVLTSSNTVNAIFYKTASNTWVLVQDGFDNNKSVTISPHTSYPDYTAATLTGSIWVKTTTPGYGANWVVKYYNGATQSWSSSPAPIYSSTRQALQALDYAGNGKNIAVGTVFIESNTDHASQAAATFKVWRRNGTSNTAIIGTPCTAIQASDSTFTIRETLANSAVWGVTKTITIHGSSTVSVAAQIPAAISAAGLTNVSASYDTTTKKVTIVHALGGDFELADGTNSPLIVSGFSAYNPSTKLGTGNLYTAPTADGFELIASNWKPLVYAAGKKAPATLPADGSLWYDSALSEVDIMIHDGATWVGYQNYAGYAGTDPAGPIISATAPATQTDGTDLVDGDIWVSTASTELYGHDVYVYSGDLLKWISQNVADQTTPNGWLFADARWSTAGNLADPASIVDLLTSNYLDPDAPDPALYPKGVKLWNLRRSGFNVKKYIAGHINLEANSELNIRYQNDPMIDYISDRWVTVSTNNEDGSGKFGRHAQRGYVVKMLKALIDTNAAVRDTDTLVFNLIATPGYTETIANMTAFNTDRGQTAFVVGDTPFRLKPNGTSLSAWGNNTALAYDNGDAGAVTYDEYMSLFYPSGYTTDNIGNNIVVPPSHMMLRTIINSDAKSYQWFAPAGTRRGGVDNATSVGYINESGEFTTVALYEGLRDVMATVKINPIATLPGVGIVNYGQYTRANNVTKNTTALDRINVARLVGYLRRQLSILAKPFLFEPNDAQTRRELKGAVDSLLLELVGQRALYDFITVCDTSNNTAARIDRSELWLDVAIEPVKAVEFIYIPLRIKNTGAISSGK